MLLTLLKGLFKWSSFPAIYLFLSSQLLSVSSACYEFSQSSFHAQISIDHNITRCIGPTWTVHRIRYSTQASTYHARGIFYSPVIFLVERPILLIGSNLNSSLERESLVTKKMNRDVSS